MTMSGVDELTAGLTGVHDDQVPGPSTPGAHRLLSAIMAEDPVPARTIRRRHYGRLVAATVAATAVTTTTVVALNAGGPVRDYANAAVDIRRTNTTYTVHVKDVYADQREYQAAFAKFGLHVTLSFEPIAPGDRRTITVVRDTPHPAGSNDTLGGLVSCPPGPNPTCPLTVKLSGSTLHKERIKVILTRPARPGEPYSYQRPALGDNPASLRLTGHTVTAALARLRGRNMTAEYMIGKLHKNDMAPTYTPPTWRPQGDRIVVGSWMRSSDSVTLLVASVKGDPAPPGHPVASSPDIRTPLKLVP